MTWTLEILSAAGLDSRGEFLSGDPENAIADHVRARGYRPARDGRLRPLAHSPVDSGQHHTTMLRRCQVPVLLLR
ncbi:MAG: hypothetical protein H0W24_02285 [Lysobacter sp.]|nr:hypothetical protein [Lysobacter sp.]